MKVELKKLFHMDQEENFKMILIGIKDNLMKEIW